MNFLSDIITYIRRIVKTSSNQALPDGLIIDYINRFYTCDVPARLQLFDLKTKFNLELQQFVDQYNVPFTPQVSYTLNNATFTIAPYPMYQGFQNPVYIDGIQVNLMNDRDNFFKTYPNFIYNQTQAQGDGVTTVFSFTTSFIPIIRAHIDVIGDQANRNGKITPISSLNSGVYVNTYDSANRQMFVQDSPWTAAMLNGMIPATIANGQIGYLISYDVSSNTYSDRGTVNYITGLFNVDFGVTPPGSGQNINTQFASTSPGTPRIVLNWNNILVVRPMPDRAYLLEADAYLSPAAFLSSSVAFQFGYMSEYLARGAARKILSDVGDMEQLQMYEPFFREQEMNVLRRSDRITTQTRTPTIFTELLTQSPQQYSGQTGV